MNDSSVSSAVAGVGEVDDGPTGTCSSFGTKWFASGSARVRYSMAGSVTEGLVATSPSSRSGACSREMARGLSSAGTPQAAATTIASRAAAARATTGGRDGRLMRPPRAAR
jgi:hypothetical protein